MSMEGLISMGTMGALVTMVLILTLLWGGLIVLIMIALRRERRKSSD